MYTSGNSIVKYILLILSLFLLNSCDDMIVGTELNTYQFLNIYLNANVDNNNYYHIEYRGYTYYQVYYSTMPNGYVVWGSPNSFQMYWQGSIFEEPIISYSTYADDYGNGQQLFWIDSNMIGDTLSIVGCVTSQICDYANIILEDNE